MARTAGRSLELLSLLQAADRWSGPALAARLGVSVRTLGRDIDTLRELGYPVHASGGRDSTYRLGAGSRLPPLVLDGEQAVAVSLALQTSPTSVLGLREAAERALATLARVMPAPLRAQVDATRVTTIRNVWEFSAPPIAPDVLSAVGDAVRRSHVLRHDVLRPDGSRPEPHDPDFRPPLRVEPHHLALWAGRWYLVAFDLDRRAWAVFRVDRIHPLSPTGQPFVRRSLPGGDVARFVRSSPDRGDTPAAWQCLGRAVLELPADVVARWAPGGSVIERVDGGRTCITVGAWSWAGIAGILATFDVDLTDVQPAELRAACHTLASRFRTT
ncbi:WYL domain-containing protein [Microlunatus spumicola]|uniref:WYL domain-containing protein n=1 Tax=Microlunatus spumicola TaxID=81499 RepID=A0ABP6XY12_9ACTN